MTHYLKAQADTLASLYASLFAPSFRALEQYGEAPPAAPTEAEVVAAMLAAVEWHRKKFHEVAEEILAIEVRGCSPALVTRTRHTLAHHEAEIVRISAELNARCSPQLMAAE